MIIPDRVNVCGNIFNIIMVDDAKAIHGGIACGLCSLVEEIIYIFRNMGFTDSTNNTTHIVKQSFSSIVNTFYHEVYHAIAGVCKMDDYNTEENAGLFGNIAVSQNKDNNLLGILETFRKIVTEISDADYRKIEYVVSNTRFEFDGLGDEETYPKDTLPKELDKIFNAKVINVKIKIKPHTLLLRDR